MNEEEFLEKLRATFQLEAEERIRALLSELASLESPLSQEDSQQKVKHIFREAHSLKGASRAVNNTVIERICQKLEDVFFFWEQQQLQPSTRDFNTLYAALDIINLALTKLPEEEVILKSLDELEKIVPGDSQSESGTLFPLKKQEKVKNEQSILNSTEYLEKINTTNSTMIQGEKESVRVSLSKLALLFQQAEEMLAVKQLSQGLLSELKHLYENQLEQEKKLNRWIDEKDSKKLQHLNNKNLSLFFREQQRGIKIVKEKLNALINKSSQNHHFTETIVDNLLEATKKILIQPISTLFEIFPRMVRDIAHSLHKEVVLEIEGDNIELDRRILEEIKAPLIHIIRNAIDHGIESKSERVQAEKPPIGKIKIIATESCGNTVTLSISDDGKGIDTQKIKALAFEKGILSSEESESISEDEIIRLALSSGISTSSKVTELSGRGLGLGIVSEKVNKLHGELIVTSKHNQGTIFNLTFPLTLSTFRGIFISVAKQKFILPTYNVDRVIRLKSEDILTIANHTAINLNGSSISFSRLADLLELTEKSPSPLFALVISAAEKTIALGVDTIHFEEDILVKNIGNQCLKVRNIMAATITEQGEVIPILNAIDLINSFFNGKFIASPITEKKDAHQQEVLLVDDSIITRLMLKNILESANYKIRVAADGMEALELLLLYPINLIITDIEMPRMDGFILIERVRAMEAMKHIPIIVLSSKESEEDRQKGRQLGANAYLKKSCFTKHELMNVLKKILSDKVKNETLALHQI